MKDILHYLFQHKTLTREQAKQVLKDINDKKYNHIEIASFLTVFAMRTITVEEMTGFVEVLQDLCIRVDLGDFDTTDMCGTGGDGKNTFNISTLASFIVAGAGYKVAKHGNYGVSSSCGSSNVMEYLGYTFTNDESKLKRDLEKANICFMHAPLFHPAMKEVGTIRKQLAVKTFFNMAGPLVNPSFPKKQAVGVFDLEVARIYKYILQQTSKDFIIVHSLDTYDEVSLTDSFKLFGNDFEEIVAPSDLGMKQITPDLIGGGDTVPEAAGIFTAILNGAGTEAQNNVVLANAALGIKVFKKNQSLIDCVEEARESLLSGKANDALKRLLA